MNSISQSTSPSLIARVKQFDPAAWERLAALYSPTVYEWARRSGLQESDAADLVQNVFQAVLLGIDRFEYGAQRPRFRSWLWGITRHKVLDFYRRRRVQPRAEGGSTAYFLLKQVAASDPALDSIDLAGPEITGDLARRALALVRTDFSEQTWQVFCQVTLQGLSPREVSEKMGMNLGAVYTAKSRVLQHLRKELGGLD